MQREHRAQPHAERGGAARRWGIFRGAQEISRLRRETASIANAGIRHFCPPHDLARGVQPALHTDMPTPKPDSSSHPTGTLAVVVLYALLFVGGWIAMYLFVFLSRGRITP